MNHSALYDTVRKVTDISDDYYIITENLLCSASGCTHKVACWSPSVLKQLAWGHRELFPAWLTYHKAVDKSIVKLHRIRSLGNSINQLRNQIELQHNNTYIGKRLRYVPYWTEINLIIEQIVLSIPLPCLSEKWLFQVTLPTTMFSLTRFGFTSKFEKE